MKAALLEIRIHKELGSSLGWMANVILVSMRKPITKMKGLYVLGKQGRVAPMPFSMDHILIDGDCKTWADLEPFAKEF